MEIGEPEASAPGIFRQTHPRKFAISILVAVHLLLAILPLGIAFIPFDSQMLPLMWALSSLPFSQLMLLSMWLGMTPGKLFPKAILASLAVSYLVIWPAAGSVLMSSEASVASFFPEYLRIVLSVLPMLAILSVVMVSASFLVGSICYRKDRDRLLMNPRIQFSLFAILALCTIICVLLGLVRLSRENSASENSPIVVVQMLLVVVVFALNLLATIWATLGTGRVMYRLAIVYVLAVLLGFSMAVGAGQSPFSEPWWLFAGSSLIVLVPTTVVALTLLYVRKLGFRLVSRDKRADPGIKPSMWG